MCISILQSNLNTSAIPLHIILCEKQRQDCVQFSVALGSRFDLAGSTLEPIMAEPVSIELATGKGLKKKAESTDHDANNVTHMEKTSLSIPASDVPGMISFFICFV